MSKQINLTGKVAVVTGAGSGIGRATARLLARHGAKVHLADLNLEAVETVVGEIEASGGTAAAHALDVTDPAAVEALAAAIFDEDGAVDILHNNAGIGHAATIESTTIEDWQRVIAVNLLGVAYGVQAFVPRMLEQGRPASVINTASSLGIVPAVPMAPVLRLQVRGGRAQRSAQRGALAARNPRVGDLPRRGQHRDHQEHDHPRRAGERPRQDRRPLRQARHLPRHRRRTRS